MDHDKKALPVGHLLLLSWKRIQRERKGDALWSQMCYCSEFQRVGEDDAEEQDTLPSTMRNHLCEAGRMFTDTEIDCLQSCWWQGRNSQAREGKLIQLDGDRKQTDWYSALPEHCPHTIHQHQCLKERHSTADPKASQAGVSCECSVLEQALNSIITLPLLLYHSCAC